RLRENLGSNLIQKTITAVGVQPRPYTSCADLFHSSLGAQVLGTNNKDNTFYESERMPEHELLHLSVEGAAPVRPSQERPTDFDLAILRVVAVEARRPDDPAVFAIDGHKRSTAFQGLAKKYLEHLFLISIVVRMLFP